MFPSNLREAMRFAIGLAIVALISHTWFLMGIVVPVVVSGRSMEPTFSSGDRLVVDRAAFFLRDPRRWEVVVLRCPDRADEFCIKRLVGLPGETVLLDDGLLYIDGKPAMKSAAIPRRGLGVIGIDGRPILVWPWPDASDNREPVSWQLGTGEYFVVGDNYSDSDDSRTWAGLVRANLLIGRPIGVR